MRHPFGQTPPEEIEAAYKGQNFRLVLHPMMGRQKHVTDFSRHQLVKLLDALAIIHDHDHGPYPSAEIVALQDWARDFRIAILAALGIEEAQP